MSTPATETKPAEEQQAPKAEETASAEAPATKVEPETKMETASGEEAQSAEAKPADESAKAEDAKGKADSRIRLNGGGRKRFRWLLDQGYSKEEALELAKEPLKNKELRDRFNADTKRGKKPMDEKVIEAQVKKLNPADKKRFGWLLQNGHTEEEALEVINKKRTNAGATKRNLSTNGGPPSKISRPSSDAAIVMVIAPKGYPSKTLTHAESNEVKAAILKEVVQQKDSETKPRFESCAHVKAGYLRLNCSDASTRQWLHRIIGKLKVPEGVPLKLIAEKNMVKGTIYTGIFFDSKKEDNAAILEFIKSQNDGLDTSKWKVISRKEVPNKQTVEMAFSVDLASSKTIQSLNNELNFKFNKVQLRKQVDPNDSQATPANRNGSSRTGRTMGSAQRGPVNRSRPASFVPIWDSNLPQKRSFNQFDNSRSNSSANGNNWGNGLGNLFGLSSNGNNGLGLDSFGGNGSFGGNNSFAGSSSFRGGNSSFGGNNSSGGSNSYGNSSGRNGGGGRNQSSSNRSLSNSLYDQLKLIGSSGGMSGSSYGSSRPTGANGSSRRNGRSSNAPRNRNSGDNSSASRMGNRNFFTTTRTGFF